MKRAPLQVLLIEDNPADAELIAYELSRAGVEMESRCVATKKEFLAELRKNPPDAIISDFSMPQFNALDALHVLKKHHIELPFILVTGSQSEEVAVECIKEGADDYILKSSLKRLPTALLSSVQRKRAETVADLFFMQEDSGFRGEMEHAGKLYRDTFVSAFYA